ncbi:MAG: Gfo/Idh/MocA family oxidoreductase [Chloroflexota bacterium]
MEVGLPATVRVGVIGLGWGMAHAAVVQSLYPAINVRALSSRSRERLEAAAAQLRGPLPALEEDWRALVHRPDVDLVVVATPDDLHRAMVLEAIGSAKHVVCEKPMAMNAADAADMLAAAEGAGVRHFTGFAWRYLPVISELKRLVDSGKLGEVRCVEGSFRFGPPTGRKSWQLDNKRRVAGALGNLGSHLIDLSLHLACGSTDTRRQLVEQLSIVAVTDRDPDWEGAGTARAGTADAELGDAHWLHLTAGAGSERHRFHGPTGATQFHLHASQRAALRTVPGLALAIHGTMGSAVASIDPLEPRAQRLEGLDGIGRRSPIAVAPEGPASGSAPRASAGFSPSQALLEPALRLLYREHIIPAVSRGKWTDGPTFVDGWEVQRVIDAALTSARSGARGRV